MRLPYAQLEVEKPELAKVAARIMKRRRGWSTGNNILMMTFGADQPWLGAVALKTLDTMDDLQDLVLGMFALAMAAVMLVAGELCLVTGPINQKFAVTPQSAITAATR